MSLPLANGLKWLAADIDSLLARVRLLIEQQQDIASAERNFKTVVDDLREVEGALAMVGAEGGRILVQEMLDTLLTVESGTLAEGDEALAAISGSTLLLSDYLDQLQQGAEDCAAVLQPSISELRLAAHRPAVTDVDLFVRQMLSRAPVMTVPASAERTPGSAAIVANKLLSPFQALLLQWLKGIDVAGTLARLRKCSEQIAAYAVEPNVVLIWSAFSAAIDSLLAVPQSDSLESKRWMGRISSHLKLLAEQGETAAAVVAPETAWRILGHAAVIDHQGPNWQMLKAALPLVSALPVEPALGEARRRLRGPNTRLLDKVASEVHADLATVKDALDLAMRAGTLSAENLAELKIRLQRVASTLSVLGLSQLGQVLTLQAAELDSLALGGDDTRGQWMRVATALLRVEHSLEYALFRPLRQTQQAGELPAPSELVEATPHTRDFRESRAALLREMLVDLARLKSELDGYLKGGALRDEGELDLLLGEVASGLVILEQTAAAESLTAVRHWLAGHRPQILRDSAEQAGLFAEAIALAEVYLEALRDELPRAGVLEERLRTAVARLPPVPVSVPDAVIEAIATADEVPAASDVGEWTPAAVVDPRVDAVVEIGTVTALPPAAPAVGDATAAWSTAIDSPAESDFRLLPAFLEEPGAAVLAAESAAGTVVVATTDSEPQQISPVVSDVAGSVTAPAAPASADPVDPEIREIFIEEAQEVGEALRRLLPVFRRDLSNTDACGDIRRAFHTLKGSGRMVGATRIGELGWAVEHLLNRCIEGALPVNAPVLAVVEQAVAALPQLLEDFRHDVLPTAAEDSAHGVAARAHYLASGRAPEMVEPEVLAVFQTDALDRLADVERALNEDPALPVDSDSVRALHTLKGSAAVVNADALSRVAGAMEHVLKELRGGEHPIPPEVRALFAELLPLLRHWVTRTGSEPAPEGAAEWLARVEALRAFLPAPVDAGSSTRRESLVNLAFDRLKIVEENLIAWMAQPADAAHAQAMGDAARALAAVSEDCLPLTRAAEAVAERLQAGDTTPPDAAFFQALVGVLERCYQYLDAYREGRLPESGHELVQQIRELPWQTAAAPLLDAMPGEPSGVAPDVAASPAPLPLDEALLTFDGNLPPLQDTDDAPGSAGVTEPAFDVPPPAASALSDAVSLPEAGAFTEPAVPPEAPVLAASWLDATPNADDPVDAELREVFLAEADELLATLQQGHAQWRGEGAPPESLARAAHTLAGSARLCGFSALGDAAYDIEQRLQRLDGSPAATDDAYAYVGASLPVFRGALAALRGNAPELTEQADTALPENRIETPAAEPVEPAGWTEPAAPLPDAPVPSVVADADDFDPDLVGIFVSEAGENLEGITGTLRQWQNGDDQATAELQRALHTLKGGARMSGFVAMGDLVHDIESRVVDLLARGQRPRGLEEQRLAVMVEALQQMHDALTRRDYSASRASALYSAAEQRLQQLQDGAEDIAAAPAANAPLEATTVEPEMSAALVAQAEESRRDAEATAAGFSPELFWRPPAEAGVSVLRRELARVPVEKLDAMLNEAGEISIYRSRLEQQNAALVGQLADMSQTITRLREQLRYMELETEAQIAARGFSAQADISGQQDFDPLELDRYTRMQELSRALAEAVGDLASIKQGMDVSATEAQGLLLQQGRINTSVQQGLMSTLMVPFSRQVARLQRVARQTAQEEGKQVELHFEGAESELDRNVLEAMTAPLEHLLRNAVVHGVESPAARRAAGKSDTGHIRVSMQREGTLLNLEIADDGAGLNFAAIRRKAQERGLMPPDLELADDEVARFIFESGFSTADKLTQNAGRGVGMDVVASEIKQLGGTLELRSVPAEGTRFIIRLPLSLALSQALIVGVGEETYALPLPSIEGIARIPRATALQVAGEEVVNYPYGGHDYRVRALAELIDQSYAVPEESRTVLAVLVRLGEGIGGGERRVALLVDRLLGNREIVSKAVGPQLSSISGVAGATIISSGEVVLILDPAALVIDRARRRLIAEASAARSQQQRAAESLGRLIMVVDDSITMRRVAERLLGRHGYRVLTAKDGVDAMTQLQHESPAAILLDIEMPRADGFEVAAFVRAEERIRDTPIIMITSRSGDKHRSRAASLGVDRYLIKPYQEDELLSAIRSLLQQREAEAA